MFPDVGANIEQTLKITNISGTMFLTFGQGQGFSLAKYCSLIDRVNRMYIYIFSVLFDTGGFFYLTQICVELGC
jgi:hypothetical protein